METPTITPTIGRKVWYWPSDYQRRTGLTVADGQPCDATVVHVRADGRVNLRVTDHIGNTHPLTGIELVQGATPAHAEEAPEGCATWMPYQAKQAAQVQTYVVALEPAQTTDTQPADEAPATTETTPKE